MQHFQIDRREDLNVHCFNYRLHAPHCVAGDLITSTEVCVCVCVCNMSSHAMPCINYQDVDVNFVHSLWF